jgi:UDP-N-acetylglucosamine 4-epimerase
VAVGERTTLNQLFELIKKNVAISVPETKSIRPVYRDFRPGDVRHSLAAIEKSKKLLQYGNILSIRQGLEKASTWYLINDL